MNPNALIDALLANVKRDFPGGSYLPFLPSAMAAALPMFCLTVDFFRGEQVEYDVTIGQGSAYVYLNLFILFGRYDVESSYRRLNDFLAFPGNGSVKATLEADQTLGGLATSVLPRNPTRGGTHQLAQGQTLGIHFPIQVEALT